MSTIGDAWERWSFDDVGALARRLLCCDSVLALGIGGEVGLWASVSDFSRGYMRNVREMARLYRNECESPLSSPRSRRIEVRSMGHIPIVKWDVLT